MPLVAWLCLSVVVSIMGPFGSYGALTLSERALFWTPLLGLGVVVGTAIRTLVSCHFGPVPSLKSSLLIAGLNAIVLAPALYALIVLVVADKVHAHVQGAEIAVLIASVSLGQHEAAASLGLGKRQAMRLVVLPQALRVIIPPLTSQYLNLTKNSSLAVAIGYPDLVSIANTTLNQTGRAIEALSIVMLVYLTLSLITSALMNWFNASAAIQER